LGKIEKMGTSRPLIGREAWGRGPPAHPAGRRFQKFFQAPPEGLFTNNKSFLFVKRSLRQASRPASGREASSPASGREVPLLIFFVIFCWNLCFTNYLKFRIFSNTIFIRHTFLYTYKILIQFYEEDYCMYLKLI
jgi:hypothetical protein